MNSISALIFDVDGTLAETERDGHRPAFNQAFHEAGLPWVWDEALYGKLLAITGGKERIAHYAQHYQPESSNAPDFTERVKRLHQAKTAHYLKKIVRGQLPLRPGIARLLREARLKGVRLAIATTTSPDNVTTLLEATLGPEAIRWFEVIGAGDIVAQKKPAPDIYHWVLAQLGLPATACLAIEDSPPGLQAARAAGLRCLVTPGEYTQGQDFSGALAIIEHLPDWSLDRILHLAAPSA